jgi:hypothetical protein
MFEKEEEKGGGYSKYSAHLWNYHNETPLYY